jgi:hypothetical protein
MCGARGDQGNESEINERTGQAEPDFEAIESAILGDEKPRRRNS